MSDDEDDEDNWRSSSAPDPSAGAGRVVGSDTSRGGGSGDGGGRGSSDRKRSRDDYQRDSSDERRADKGGDDRRGRDAGRDYRGGGRGRGDRYGDERGDDDRRHEDRRGDDRRGGGRRRDERHDSLGRGPPGAGRGRNGSDFRRGPGYYDDHRHGPRFGPGPGPDGRDGGRDGRFGGYADVRDGGRGGGRGYDDEREGRRGRDYDDRRGGGPPQKQRPRYEDEKRISKGPPSPRTRVGEAMPWRGGDGKTPPPPPAQKPRSPRQPPRDNPQRGHGEGRGLRDYNDRSGRGGDRDRAFRGGQGGRGPRSAQGGRGRSSPASGQDVIKPGDPLPENQRRTLALSSVPVQYLSHRDLWQYFERRYNVRVQHACTTSDECVVDSNTGLSTAYVKFKSHEDAVHVLDEIGKVSGRGMVITIGEGNDMVSGIKVTGLHENNFLGENKRFDRQKHQKWDGYNKRDGNEGYEAYPTQQSEKPPRQLNPQEEKRRKAREESRQKRQEQFEEARKVEEQRRAKIAEVRADCAKRHRDLTSKVDKLSKVEDMTQKQLALHKKMLGLIKDATDKAAKMREILDLQKKANETKKDLMSTQAELDALAKEEGDRIREINVWHKQEQRRYRQKFSLDKRSSTLVVTGFPFDCNFAEDAVRKHFVSALGGKQEQQDDGDDDGGSVAADKAIKSMQVEDDGGTVVLSFVSRSIAEKAKANGGDYQGSALAFKWRHGTGSTPQPQPPPPSASSASIEDEGGQIAVTGNEGRKDDNELKASAAADDAYEDGDDNGDELMINYDYGEDEDEEARWR